MRLFWLIACLLTLTTFACGDGDEATTQTARRSPTPAAERQTASPGPTPEPTPTPAAEAELLIGVTIHLEGWSPGEAVAQRYAEHMRAYADVFERYGARITFEASAAAIAGSADYGDNVLGEMVSRGHGVGVHADVGGSRDDTQEEMVATLAELKRDLEALGVSVRHVSGTCSHLDWVGAAIETGYEFLSGVVSYCWSSVPEAERPAEYANCSTPTACHEAQPETLPERIQPWRPASSEDWITHDPAGGLVVIPSSGGLNCQDSDEASRPGGCPFDQADIDRYVADIEASLAAAAPGEVNTHYVVSSLGSPLDTAVLEAWLQAVQPFVDSGRVRWATLPEMYDAFVAAEG